MAVNYKDSNKDLSTNSRKRKKKNLDNKICQLISDLHNYMMELQEIFYDSINLLFNVLEISLKLNFNSVMCMWARLKNIGIF